MGREDTELWYSEVDFSDIQVLIIEWTHGNNDSFKGVDIPVLLNSTPEETLAHRKARNRDGATDSPFTTMVLEIEQELLKSQAHKAKIIISKSGELWDFEEFKAHMGE
jgi:alpha-galactosidase